MLVFAGFAFPAHAALLISKIVADPPGANAGHQWIAITNTGPDEVDLGAKNIRLFDPSGNHLIKSYNNSDTMLAVGATATITKDPITFLNDHPDFDGQLLKSSFLLPAAGGFVGIVQTDGTVLVKETYTATPKTSATGANAASGNAASASAGKPGTGKGSSTKRGSRSSGTRKSSSESSSGDLSANNSNEYGNGTLAPAAGADAPAAGALGIATVGFSLPSLSFPAVPIPNLPLFYSPWFAAFLGLLAFSSFSLIVIERYVPSDTSTRKQSTHFA